MKVGIFGSRTLKDNRVKIAILETIQEVGATEIITTQEPAGVCEVAQRVAKELPLPLHLHFLNFKYLRGAFEHRSKEVIREADYILLIHDGKSIGTANELKLVLKAGKKHKYLKMDVVPEEKDIGFNITQDWNSPEFKGIDLKDLSRG